ncbi:iron (metal) dependent repressor, DtxR family [Ruminococcaceae bacterium YRB3002]|nr:iron (metal) dependent repressor, DtxR family [Ruminococcaceae bacterium YRB3002]
MAIQESGEMYLETIYVLSQSSDEVRSIDIGKYMGFSKPSVSRAIGVLKKNGYVSIDEQGHIQLTDAGKKIAKTIYERHTVLTEMLISLGVDKETATEDACRIEHYISDKSFKAIKKHMKEYKTDRK